MSSSWRVASRKWKGLPRERHRGGVEGAHRHGEDVEEPRVEVADGGERVLERGLVGGGDLRGAREDGLGQGERGAVVGRGLVPRGGAANVGMGAVE